MWLRVLFLVTTVLLQILVCFGTNLFVYPISENEKNAFKKIPINIWHIAEESLDSLNGNIMVDDVVKREAEKHSLNSTQENQLQKCLNMYITMKTTKLKCKNTEIADMINNTLISCTSFMASKVIYAISTRRGAALVSYLLKKFLIFYDEELLDLIEPNRHFPAKFGDFGKKVWTIFDEVQKNPETFFSNKPNYIDDDLFSSMYNLTRSENEYLLYLLLDVSRSIKPNLKDIDLQNMKSDPNFPLRLMRKKLWFHYIPPIINVLFLIALLYILFEVGLNFLPPTTDKIIIFVNGSQQSLTPKPTVMERNSLSTEIIVSMILSCLIIVIFSFTAYKSMKINGKS